MTPITRASPLHRQLKENIRRQISSKQVKPNDKIASIREISDQYHVSEITVRRAIADLAAEGYLYSIHGKGTFVKGIPLPATKFIGLDIPNIENNYFNILVNGFKKETAQYKCRLALFDSFEATSGDVFSIKSIQGMLIRRFAPYTARDAGYCSDLQKAHLPFVLIDGVSPEAGSSSVVFDNYGSMYKAAAYLVDVNADRIIYFDSGVGQIASERLSGFVKAMADREVDPKNYLIINTGQLSAAAKDYINPVRAFEPKAVIIPHPLHVPGLLNDLEGLGAGYLDGIIVCGVVEENFKNYIHADIVALVKPAALLVKEAAAILFRQINHQLKAPARKTIAYQMEIPEGLPKPANMDVLVKTASKRNFAVVDV